MSFDLYEKQDFLNAATAAEKPVAFLVGSPLSWDADGGVPGIDAMLDLVRAEIKQRKPKAMCNLDAAIVKKSGAAEYQAALRALHANIGQDAVNRVVRNAVYQARNPAAPKPFEDDGNPADWHLPGGTIQLAELICRNAEFSSGPILTTNFDPLLSLAIRAVGGNVHRRIVDGEGAIGREAECEPGTRNVVHLHGYWRGSDTLHTHAQLVAGRVRLKASLQNLLRQKTLIVVAYAGWDDIFTKALVELLDDDEAKLDVLWCFREADRETVRARYGDLIEKLQPSIARGRFRAYGGIDCHAIFGEIAAELAAEAVPVAGGPALPLVSPLPGWQRLDAATLDAMAPLKEGEALRYYDGATPTWRHALSDRVPRRESVDEIAKRRTGLSEDAGSLQLIRAAGGEGKTTLLLQAAVDAARDEGVDVLWRPSPRISLSPEQIAGLDPQRQWLIVADDAENLVRVIAESARLLHAEDRANVDFLLAARDADWKSTGGDRQPWAQWLQHQPDILLRGVSEVDAKAVVAAWARAGAAGLRELAQEADTEKRAAALVEAVNDALQTADENRGDGSFFGGLLALRFGEAGLRAHVREFLMRLRETPIQNCEQSLADALLYVAACHGAGISGLDENVLADLVGVPRDWVGSRVVRPLGEEAAAVSGGGQVYTRHSQVAAAILLEAEAALDVDLTEVWARLVKQTVRTSSEVTVHHETHSKVIHAGPRLQQNLPAQLPEERRKAIAIAAARADVEAEPERLSPIVDLGRTYRKADKEHESTALFRKYLVGAERKIDHAGNVRGYWYEWAVCESESGSGNTDAQAANAWLCGLSLSDHLNPARITDTDIKLGCAGLGVAFGKLATAVGNCPYARARRAVVDLGRRVALDPRAAGYFDRHDREADAFGTPRPRDFAESVAWLASGVAAAGKAVTDPFLAGIAMPEKVSFTSLQAALGRRR